MRRRAIPSVPCGIPLLVLFRDGAEVDRLVGAVAREQLRQWLDSANTAPVGQPAGSNFERYSNPQTDALINSYGDTTSAAQQHAIVNKLEDVMLKDVPVIPVTESVDWYQYSTANFTGWVTQADPYAQPAPYSYPDWGQMLLKLQAKS